MPTRKINAGRRHSQPSARSAKAADIYVVTRTTLNNHPAGLGHIDPSHPGHDLLLFVDVDLNRFLQCRPPSPVHG